MIISIPKDVLLQEAYTIRNKSFVLTCGILSITALCAWFLGRFIRKPLQNITNIVRDYDTTENTNDALPVARTDEIGEFARAFQDLTDSLQKSQSAEQKILSRL